MDLDNILEQAGAYVAGCAADIELIQNAGRSPGIPV